MPKQAFEVHPVANIFPMMSEDEYQGLKADIAEFGQHEAITVWCNLLIDGRNRLRACDELGIEPMVCELDESTDPVGWAVSYNLHRRHLSTSQRANVAAKLETLKHGDVKSQKNEMQNCISREDAAKMMNVSPRSVADAKKVQEHGSEELKRAVERDEIPVSTAANLVKAVPDKKEQSKLVTEGPKAVKQAVAPKKKEPEPEIEWEDFDDEPEQEDCKVKEFKKFWEKCSEVSRVAIRLWIEDQPY
jgi:hypothetical protein